MDYDLPARSARRVRFLVGSTVVSAVTFGACSDSGGGSLVDRAAVDATMTAIATRYFADGASHERGVVLEDEDCPVLGDRTVADIVSDSNVGVSLSGGRSSGFLHRLGDGLSVQCSTRTDGVTATISVVQVPDLDAAEYARTMRLTGTLELTFTVEEFDDGGPVVVVRDERDGLGALTWVEDSLAIGLYLRSGDGEVAVDDRLAVLASVRQVVLDTLEETSESVPNDAGDLDRAAILDAFDVVLSDADRSDPLPLIDRDAVCPVLHGEPYDTVSDALRWDDDVVDAGEDVDRAGRANVVEIMPSRRVTCMFGRSPGNRIVNVLLGRPVSVAEYAAFIEGPLTPMEGATVTALDASADELGDDRSFVLELPVDQDQVATNVGWIDNGLMITVSLAAGDDPEEILAIVVPAVLGNLDLR